MENRLLKKQEFAYNAVKGQETNYKSFIENFGLLVYNNGLISAMAVAKAKAKKDKLKLYEHIQNWLRPTYYLFGFAEGDLLKNLVQVDSIKLLTLTDEVISLADVLKEFAKAEIK